MAEPVMCTLTRVWTANNGGVGFNIGTSGAGTSTTFDSCWARNNTGNGWQVTGNYYSFNGCGADINGGEGWNLNNCQSCSISGCGSEANAGNAIHLTNSCFAVAIDGMWVSNHAIGLLIDASCFRINVAGFLETALSGATHGIQVGAGGIANLIQPQLASGVNIVSGGAFVTQIQDNGIALQGVPILLQQANTGAGFALVNATPNIMTWTSPNDSKIHRFAVFGNLEVAVAGVGGQVNVAFTDPGGNLQNRDLQDTYSTPGFVDFYVHGFWTCAPNTTVTVKQQTALTSGTVTLYAELWAS
jgi:hypothetical protein